MEFLLDVFGKLSIDQTFFVQFILVIVFFFLLKTVLFSKLQFVLELRDSKTTKLEENANKKFNQVEQMQEKIKKETEKAYEEAQEIFSSKKSEITEREKARFKEVENKVTQEAEEKRASYEGEVLEQKKKVMDGADQLADNLVDRIVQ